MKFETFRSEYVEAARKIALENLNEEREYVKSIPEDSVVWDLSYFAENELGIAAIDEGKLVGFLCWFFPWEGAFDTQSDMGTFSPLHANGAAKENRYRIYQDMYEEASKRLAGINVKILGICLYAHDEVAKSALFEYGFGMRCKDCITRIGEADISSLRNRDVKFYELCVEEFPRIRELRFNLNEHLKEAPCFMQSDEEDYHHWIEKVEKGDRRTFVAERNGEIVAYMDVGDEGENFVTVHPKMRSLQGAYCKPELRGMGISDDLLMFAKATLKKEGYEYLGVDFESYNSTANRFWLKHFEEYTNSVIRRVELWCKKY